MEIKDIALIIGSIGSTIIILTALFRGIQYLQRRLCWRSIEYKRINKLSAGISIAKFDEALGSALINRKEGVLTESTFKGRDYWVQAVHDQSGTVHLYSITACNMKFRPKTISHIGHVTLNDSRLNSIGANPFRIRYFISGATANSIFYDEYGGGIAPSLYKWYFVGVNDACPSQNNYMEIVRRYPSFFDVPREFVTFEGVSFRAEDSIVADFRANSIPNTYAETAPFTDPQVIINSFQVGVDRILLRTLPND